MYSTIEAFGIENDTITSIGEFAVLWGILEEKYFERCCTSRKLNRMKVDSCTDSIAECVDEIRVALLKHYHSPSDILKHFCFRKSDNGIEHNVDLFLNDRVTKSEEKVFAAICICFRIRSNLFHGEKVFWLLNQQKTIIDACSTFLNEIINENIQINL